MTSLSPRVRRIVVGVDRSPGAALAVGLTARLAADLNAEVIVVHGSQSSPEGPPSEEDLAAWQEPLVAAGVTDIRTVVEADDAVRLLFRTAEEADAYLIVVGPTHHSELGSFVLGSIATALAHHGRRPLVIAPTPHSEIDPF